MFFIPFDAQPGDDWFMRYWHILSDTAHLSVELTMTVVVDVLLLGLLWPAIRSYFNRKLAAQHAQLDAEHGIHHHDDHIHLEADKRLKHDEHPDHDC